MKAHLPLSHIHDGLPGMVDVQQKIETVRTAEAISFVRMPRAITDAFCNSDIASKKGPVFATAIIAATMAAKQTSTLIPLCHSLMLEHVLVDISIKEPGLIAITCAVRTTGKTGVEMEALMGASVGALTIYDMCKAITKDMVITETKLLTKTGGKHDMDKP